MILGLCLHIALFSCKKENSNIGAELIDNPNRIDAESTEIFEITTYNQVEDSVQTSGISNAIIGAINTEETGLTSSYAYITFIPDSLDRSFPTSNFAIESFNLNLHVLDVYGTNGPLSFEIYQLQNPVNNDSIYYHFDSLPLSNLIGEFTIENIDSGFYSFPLDSSFGATFINASEAYFESNENFKNFFGGICIKPKSSLSNNTGSIYKLNITDISLSLSYTTENPSNEYDNQLLFEIESDKSIFTQFNQDFSGSQLSYNVNDTSLGLEYFYVQGMGSCIGKIKLPNIQDWYDSNNYIINKFELQFYVEENSVFPLPKELILTYTNSKGDRYYKSAILNEEQLYYNFSISPSETNDILRNNSFELADFVIEHPQPGKQGELAILLGMNSEKPPLVKLSYTRY